MTVADLIAFLKQQPQDLPVAQEKFSEHCLLDVTKIEIKNLCEARQDGWIHDERPDKQTTQYLVFPG